MTATEKKEEEINFDIEMTEYEMSADRVEPLPKGAGYILPT